MKCPVDKTDMIVVEHMQIELDYCLQCEGVWFDSGELDLLISAFAANRSDTSIDSLLTQQKVKTNETRRKCPICRHKMEKGLLGDNPEVLIDICPIGDGLWFDGGELHHVLHQIGHTNSKDLISFLGDALEADNQF